MKLLAKTAKLLKQIAKPLRYLLNLLKKIPIPSKLKTVSKKCVQKLSPAVVWLKSRWPSRKVQLALLGLVIFNLLLLSAFKFIQPSSLKTEVSQIKSAISARSSLLQSLPSPDLWELGQRDTAIAYQAEYLSNLDSSESFGQINRSRYGLVKNLYRPELADAKSAKEINQQVKDFQQQSDALLAHHSQTVSAVQYFIEFSCESYITQEALGNPEVLGTYMALADNALNSLPDSSNEYSNFNYTTNTVVDELRAFKVSLSADNLAKEVIETCQSSQENISNYIDDVWQQSLLQHTQFSSSVNSRLSSIEARL